MAASNSNHRGTSGAGIQIGSAWFQRKINLRPQHRGVHLVTEEILRQMPELGQFSVGLCHVQSKKIAFSSPSNKIYLKVKFKYPISIQSWLRTFVDATMRKKSRHTLSIYT